MVLCLATKGEWPNSPSLRHSHVSDHRFAFALGRAITMEQDRSFSAPQKATLSPLLSEFLGLIRSNSNPSRNDHSILDSLVAFRQNTQTPLSLQDLTIAFRRSLFCKDAGYNTAYASTTWYMVTKTRYLFLYYTCFTRYI